MKTGFKSYTKDGVVSIDSNFKGFAFTKKEVHTRTAVYPGWIIKQEPDEVLVLGASSHPTLVMGYSGGKWVVACGVPKLPGERREQITANIEIYRFSSKPPAPGVGLNIYTNTGEIAFTSQRKMLRPFRYFPVGKEYRWWDANYLSAQDSAGNPEINKQLEIPAGNKVGLVLWPSRTFSALGSGWLTFCGYKIGEKVISRNWFPVYEPIDCGDTKINAWLDYEDTYIQVNEGLLVYL